MLNSKSLVPITILESRHVTFFLIICAALTILCSLIHSHIYIQVDSIGYRETVIQKRLKKYWDQIKARLGIDWTKTQWQDLEKPLYSGLAARLFLIRFRAPIPSDVLSQARYWKRYYNTSAGKGTVQKFIDDVEQGTGCVA